MSDLYDLGEVCQICGRGKTNLQEICECGYHFGAREIKDWTSIGRYLDELKAKDWKKEVQIKKVIWNVQKKKNSRFSQRQYAKLLGQSLSHISLDLQLAEALEKYPQLHECKNKRHAFQKLKSIGIRASNFLNTGTEKYQPFKEEKDLRDFLARNWDRTPLAASWELVRSEYPTSIGPIDLLAQHKTEKKRLVIELKITKTSDDVIGQILRYMGWVKLNLALGEDEKVEGLIIASGIDANTLCSLVHLKDVVVKLYSLEDKIIRLDTLDEGLKVTLMAKVLGVQAIVDFFEALRKGQEPDPRVMKIIETR